MGDNNNKPRISILVRIAIVIIVAKILSLTLITMITGRSMMERAANGYKEIAHAAAEDIKNKIDTSKPVLEMTEKERQIIIEESRAQCENIGLKYIYVVDIDPDGDYTYVTVAAEDEEENVFVQKSRGFGTVVEKELRPAEKSILSGETEEGYQFIDNRFGDVCTYLFPIKDENGKINGIIGVDVDISDIREGMKQEQNYLLFLELMNFIALFTITLILVKHIVIAPIAQLSDRMRSFLVNKDIESHTKEKAFSDEITDIENSFDKMARDISNYIKELEELSLEKAKTQTQLDVARRIQCDIIPLRDLIMGSGYDVYGFEKPARDVGGDFYDIYDLNDNEICVTVGDISGKGISAALFMVMVKTILKNCIKSGSSLADTLGFVNREICRSNSQDMFATVFITVLNTETGVLKYANAGHDRQMFLSEEPGFLNPESGMPLGIFSDAEFSNEETVLKDGQGILLFTDGVTETIDKDKKQYGEDGLSRTVKEFLSSNNGRYEAENLVNSIVDAVSSHSEGLEQFDDITCVALIFRDNKEDRLTFAPGIESFNKVREILLDVFGNGETGLMKIMACEEMFSNIVNYSGTDSIRCSFEKVDNSFYVTFIDTGVEFDPVRTLIRDKDFMELDTGGMGIKLARMNSKEMIYERVGRKNHLVLKFDI